MITQSQAQYLLELPKLLTDNGNYLQHKTFGPSLPISERLFMASELNTDFIFFLEIFQSSKNQLKLSLHFQEDETSIGILRADFNQRHLNPVEINDHVPDIMKQYAGQWVEESHIHYFVEGYRPMAWAIPLSVDDTFPIKQFFDEIELGSIINAFGDKINLQTVLDITIQTRIT